MPDALVESAWLEHAPFAFWIIDAHRPRTLVELGTHHGFSYLAFCQAIDRLGVDTRAFAVDHWLGDQHAGFFGPEVLDRLRTLHDSRYGGFSQLIQSSFDQALEGFEEGEIDLLHIDGAHDRDSVSHDVETWLPKLSSRGVLLLHDINVRERGFGVHTVWTALKHDHPHFEFDHGHGLGVLGVGAASTETLGVLFDLSGEDSVAVRHAFSRLGAAVADRRTLEQQRAELAAARRTEKRLRNRQRRRASEGAPDRNGRVGSKPRHGRTAATAPRRRRTWRSVLSSIRSRIRRLRQRPRSDESLRTTDDDARRTARSRGNRGRTSDTATPAGRRAETPTRDSGRDQRIGAGQRRRSKQSRPKTGARATPPSLDAWLDAYGSLEPLKTGTTRFSIVCPVYETPPELLRSCVRSVVDQTYASWEMLLVDDDSSNSHTRSALVELVGLDDRITLIGLETHIGIAGASNVGAEAASGDYLVFLDHDDVLAPTALSWLSSCAPDADLIYTDEDKVGMEGEHSGAVFKPAWSPRLLLGSNYVNHAMCIRIGLFREVGGFRTGLEGAEDHDLLLRLAERPMTVAHVPNILCHRRSWEGPLSQRVDRRADIEQRGLGVVEDAIRRRGWNAHAALGNGIPFNYRVVFDPDPEPPLVKIVMPTRDRADLLRVATDGVLTRTDGVETHLVIVDNGSREPEALALISDLGARPDVTVLTIDDAFNFSRLCNTGVAAGPDAPLVLLLNNDVAIRHREWLLQLTGWLRDPNVVGVGPLLLYPDGTIQQAGVVLGIGRAGATHYASGQPNQPRRSSYHDKAREVSCLTAACLLVRASDYRAVGGMNEDLAIDFQDVDLCLRLSSGVGGAFVYDPTFPLTHHEMATRGTIAAGSGYTVERMRFLWGSRLLGPDPFYSPHLNRREIAIARIPETPEDRLARLDPRISSPRLG